VINQAPSTLGTIAKMFVFVPCICSQSFPSLRTLFPFFPHVLRIEKRLFVFIPINKNLVLLNIPMIGNISPLFTSLIAVFTKSKWSFYKFLCLTYSFCKIWTMTFITFGLWVEFCENHIPTNFLEICIFIKSFRKSSERLRW